MSEEMRETAANGGDKSKKEVFTVVDRGPNKKAYWLRVGWAYENRDSSWNVKLDALPTNGTLQIRDYEPREQLDAARGDGAHSDGARGAAAFHRRGAGGLG